MDGLGRRGLGTLGLPAILGKGYHLEIKQDVPVDTSPPKGFEGVGRIGGPDDDTDDLPKRVKPVAEVRRSDEV